ncbi:DinB family protein [Lysinibacillus sp. NPDC096418]|uniref:DinB family protein n=1 Tax=Lysinibacillus sp. NPDC096418 TaxID=3364138 RepID=UPI003828AD3C
MNQIVNDKLSEARINLLQEISELSDVQFNSKPELDTWSIAQVCHHLVLVEEATIKAIAWRLTESSSIKGERKKIENIILDRSKKLRAPKIVEPDENPFKVQQIMASLNDTREKLMTFLSTIEDKSILAEKTVKHPALGEIFLDQWIEQIYLHEQRHIEQIKEIKLLLE